LFKPTTALAFHQQHNVILSTINKQSSYRLFIHLILNHLLGNNTYQKDKHTRL
jgi:hypothetical protein